MKISEPINTGCKITIEEQTFPFYAAEGSFAEAIIYDIERNGIPEVYTGIYKDSQSFDAKEVFLSSGEETTITYDGKSYTYPISKEAFFKELLSSFSENSLLWCAEPNYFRIIKEMNQEQQKEYFTKFQKKQKELLKKINYFSLKE